MNNTIALGEKIRKNYLNAKGLFILIKKKHLDKIS